MHELIKVELNEVQEPIVSGRELHEFLEVETPYTQWFERMCEYGFIEKQDYQVLNELSQKSEGSRIVKRTIINHALKMPMAKEISMLQRNEKGKQARQYFIAIEEEYNNPQMVMARALKLADRELKQLRLQNSELVTENAIMAPKAEYFDDLIDRNLLTNFRDTAKMYQVKEKDFIKFLVDKKYIYRDKKGKLMPTAEKNTDLFEVKESKNDRTGWAGTQTMITPRGRETFRLLVKGL